MGISGLPLGFAVHVPNSPGDLFLCFGFDGGCLSNLLAGTSLKATWGVAVDVGGLWGWRSEGNWQAPGTEDFPFPSLGPASRRKMSLTRCIMGVSFTEDQTPQGLA